MSENDLPPGWAMPDDLAKKISEVLNHKPITPEDELSDAQEDMARDIALIEPDPKDWGWWVGYLLEQIEIQSEQRRIESQYQQTLLVLVGKIENRIKGGKW